MTISLLLVTASTVSVTAISNQGMTKIKGTVVDPNDAVIVNAQITFRSGDRKTRAYSSKDIGVFEIELTEGVYEVEIERLFFKKLVVTNLEVMNGMTEELKFQLEPLPGVTTYCQNPFNEQIEKVSSPLSGTIRPRKIH